MAVWKVEHGAGRKFVLNDPNRCLDLVALLAIAAAPGFLLLLVLPLPFVLPALSILSFFAACGLALAALHSKSRYRERIQALWDIAYAFTFVWLVAGMLGNPKYVIDWLDQFAAS